MRQLNRQLLISYTHAFVSYLFRMSALDASEIKGIYLFGSVARAEADKESDIDIFVDCQKSSENNVKRIIERALRNFYRSEEKRKFTLLGIYNEMNVICGALDEWELKESIKNDALVIYSPSLSYSLRSHFLVIFEPIKDITKRNRVIRKLFGRREKHYKDKGFVLELKGEIIDNKTFIVPSEEINKILKIFSREKINYKIKKIWR